MHRGALDAVLLAPLVVTEGLFEAAACSSARSVEERQGKEGLTGFEHRGEVERDLRVVRLEGGRDATAEVQSARRTEEGRRERRTGGGGARGRVDSRGRRCTR